MKDVLEPFSDIGAPATACWCDCFEGSSRSCDEHKAALVAEVRRLDALVQSTHGLQLDAEAERDAARAEAERQRERADKNATEAWDWHDKLSHARAEVERLRDLVDEFRKRDESQDRVRARLIREQYAASAEAARVREALQAVRDLHHRIVLHDWCNHADRDACSAFETVDGDWVCGEPVGDACAECEEDGEHVVTYPCATVRALDAALDGEQR